MKQGEGTFFQVEAGRALKGIWMNDVCKCSMMQDDELSFPSFSTHAISDF
jgi:hypothetical protein